MFKVIVIQPSNVRCGGDPATEESAAKVYGSLPTGIIVTRIDELKVAKYKHRTFFRAANQKYHDYIMSDRGWHFPTKKEAVSKMLYEARGAGHLFQTKYGWQTL